MDTILAELAKQSLALGALVAFLIYLTKVLIPKMLGVFQREMLEERKLCREAIQSLGVEFKGLAYEIRKLSKKLPEKGLGRQRKP